MTALLHIISKGSPWVLAMATLIGVVVAVLTFLDKPRRLVEVQVLSDSNVVDVNQPLPDLRLVFQGEDITEGELALRLVTLRVANTGDADLL